MRYALILAGGSGTRLWPLSREALPKQLAPLAGGRCLLEEAYDRLEGLVPESRRFVCGAERHRAASLAAVAGLASPSASGLDRYIGEPRGPRHPRRPRPLLGPHRAARTPRPSSPSSPPTTSSGPRPSSAPSSTAPTRFVEARPDALVTFGVEPDRPVDRLRLPRARRGARGAARAHGASRARFREKPDAASAAAFVAAGPGRYLWNSGMFVWRASRFLELVGRYEPELAAAVARHRVRPRAARLRLAALASAYPSLKKISVDYGVMERASKDPDVTIAALPLVARVAGHRLVARLRRAPAHGRRGQREPRGNGPRRELGQRRRVDRRGAPRRLPRLRGPRRRAHAATRPWSARRPGPTSSRSSTLWLRSGTEGSTASR